MHGLLVQTTDPTSVAGRPVARGVEAVARLAMGFSYPCGEETLSGHPSSMERYEPGRQNEPSRRERREPDISNIVIVEARASSAS
jgi:hypothetical protein